jgi:hypothetical protein
MKLPKNELTIFTLIPSEYYLVNVGPNESHMTTHLVIATHDPGKLYNKERYTITQAKIIIHSIHLHSPCNTSHSSHDEKSTSKQAKPPCTTWSPNTHTLFLSLSLSLSLSHTHTQTSSPACNSRDPQNQFAIFLLHSLVSYVVKTWPAHNNCT